MGGRWIRLDAGFSRTCTSDCRRPRRKGDLCVQRGARDLELGRRLRGGQVVVESVLAVDCRINVDSLTSSAKHRPMNGREGIVAAETAPSEVEGETGRLVLAGYRVEELAPNATPEEVAYLLLNGRLPNDAERGHSVRRSAHSARCRTRRWACCVRRRPVRERWTSCVWRHRF